ncbi:uncharacterized protein PFL1_04996 [Pseudozyma flocculosa PF-1]|uniref:Pal1 cell morphology protein n=1 Tax=Pseudozyma flocculosa PF-1 TaxID=1277687 RepID=A0A061H4F1_9BASI|nr:uncharacterized protein PFL1_04996 [Pseudozyma flocculosa PF-1]EPQ27458.1 hypothetical protein PFL1_04996 [Pseudozyma flocculosa PF-1]
MARAPTGREAVLAALSDVVTVSPTSAADPSRPDRYEPSFSYSGAQPMPVTEPPPMVPARSPFENNNLPAPPPPPAKSGMAGKFANAFRRQTAEEKEAKRKAKEARMHEEINKSAAKSSRMDVIDRLDLSGINGASMFHHDSPYDACTPHMNRGKRAPVKAFDPNIDPMTGLPYRNGANGGRSDGRRGPSPLAKNKDLDDDDEKAGGSSSRPSLSTNGSRGGRRSATAPMVPSLGRDAQASTAELSLADDDYAPDADVDAEREWRANQGYHTQPSAVPDSRLDVSNPNADVWGVTAEPWQDFAQPKQREKGSRSLLSPHGAGGAYSGTTSAASSVFDMEAVMTGKKPARTEDELAAGSASPFPEPNWQEKNGASDGPKRSKSLMKRIKSMKENPNVPPPDDGVEMGALNGRRRRGQAHRHSPSTPPIRTDGFAAQSSSRAAADAAVGLSPGEYSGRGTGTPLDRHAEEAGDSKATPRNETDTLGYFGGERNERPGRSPGEGGLGRSGSIFNKFKRGGKASKSSERESVYA